MSSNRLTARTARSKWTIAFECLIALAFTAAAAPQALPNPYRIADGWAQLPNGRAIGAVGNVAIDRTAGTSGRWSAATPAPDAFGDECRDSNSTASSSSIADGKVVRSFGGGMFIWPHGLEVDADGNVWVTDAASAERTTPTASAATKS